MAEDIRQLLHDAAPDDQQPPDFDRLWHRGRRQRRWSQLAGASIGVIVIVAALAGPWTQLPTPQIGPIGDIAEIGEVETRTLDAVVVDDAWIGWERGSFADPPADGSPDEARSEQHVWDEEIQLWLGPVQTLGLYVQIPDGADGLLIESEAGLIFPPDNAQEPGSWIVAEGTAGPWIANAVLDVYHDRVHETADQLVITIRAIASDDELVTGPTVRSDWPTITETSAPTRVTDFRTEP